LGLDKEAGRRGRRGGKGKDSESRRDAQEGGGSNQALAYALKEEELRRVVKKRLIDGECNEARGINIENRQLGEIVLGNQ